MWFTAAWTIFKGLFSFGNISKWFGFITTHWKEVLVGAILTLFAYVMFSPWQFLFGLDTVPSLNKKIDAVQHALDIKQEQLNTCVESNEKLAAGIDDQNSHIKGWGDLSKKIDKSTQELKTKIDKSRQQSKKDVQSILDEPTPQDCAAAIDYLRKSRGDLTWKSNP